MKWWDRRELVPAAERMAVLAAAALLVWSAWSWLDRAVLPPRGGADPTARAEAAERGASVLDETLRRVNERAILQPPKPRGFQLQLTGVAGSEAIFTGGQKAGVGGEVGGAKVLAVGPNWAEIEFEGNQQTLHLFGPAPGSAPGGGPPAGTPGGPAGAVPGPAGPPGTPLDAEQRRRMREMPGGTRAVQQ